MKRIVAVSMLFLIAISLIRAETAALAQRPTTAVGQSRRTPVVIVRNESHPSSIAVDGASVYWVSDSGSTVKKVSKAGVAPTTIIAGQKNIHRITVDEDNVYFETDDDIRRVSKSGGSATTLASLSRAEYVSDVPPVVPRVGGGKPDTVVQHPEYYFVVDDTNVYYVDNAGKGVLQIKKISKGGGEPTSLASEIYAPNGLAADAANIYWTDYADDSVKRVSVNGGRAAIFARCGGPVEMAMDASGIYCAHFAEGGGEIIGFAKSDGRIISRATLPDVLVFWILPDETNLYAMVMDKGLYKINKNGGRTLLLAPFRAQFRQQFAVDATDIYWADSSRGAIMRINK